MSSFIVSDNCINTIVSYLDSPECREHIVGYVSKVDALFPSKKGFPLLRKMGENLLKMNVSAYRQRYAHVIKEDEAYLSERLNLYQFYRDAKATKQLARVLKCIDCLHYQANEGDTDKTKLFRALEKLGEIVAYQFASESKEYKEAEWG